MTRRILLVLDESVGETECGDCVYSTLHPVDGEWFCSRPEFERSCRMPATVAGMRLPECLAAEHAAERCVEIEPGDAASLRDEMLRCDFDMRLIGTPGERAGLAIDQHAAKARGGAK